MSLPESVPDSYPVHGHVCSTDRLHMPIQDSDDRYILNATLTMLSLALVAAIAATLIPWMEPVHHPLDMIVPPAMCLVFIGLLVALIRRPHWVLAIARIALFTGGLALAAPSWLYTVQATLTPGLRLIDILPPVASLLLVLLVLVMIYLPAREAYRVALLAWVLIALPVLVYLFGHPQELWAPRGIGLLMTYGPVMLMVVVLVPMRRGLTGKIDRLMSERVRMEINMHRDPLTRIHNRRLGERVLQDVLSAGTPAGVIMFDMDHFKAINDTHGHPVGDQVLQQVARRCQSLLRKDACVTRWGGEEFMVVVPDVDAASLLQVAERLRAAIAGLSMDPLPGVTASFGVTMVEDGDSLSTLLRRVDQALYKAKRGGGDNVVRAPDAITTSNTATPA